MIAMSRLVALLFDEESLFFESGSYNDEFEAVEEDIAAVNISNAINVEADSIKVGSKKEKKECYITGYFIIRYSYDEGINAS